MMKRLPRVLVYRQETLRSGASPSQGRYGCTHPRYMRSVSDGLAGCWRPSGVVVCSYDSDATLTPPPGPSMAGKP